MSQQLQAGIAYEEIWLKAKEEAAKAYEASKPQPIAWQQSGLNEGFDWSKPYNIEPEGLCGYAWIWIPNGRHPFVNWMKKNGKGRKNWSKGYDIWTSELCQDTSQSVERKEAAMKAAVKVLRENGIEAYSESRLD